MPSGDAQSKWVNVKIWIWNYFSLHVTFNVTCNSTPVSVLNFIFGKSWVLLIFVLTFHMLICWAAQLSLVTLKNKLK